MVSASLASFFTLTVISFNKFLIYYFFALHFSRNIKLNDVYRLFLTEQSWKKNSGLLFSVIVIVVVGSQLFSFYVLAPVVFFIIYYLNNPKLIITDSGRSEILHYPIRLYLKDILIWSIDYFAKFSFKKAVINFFTAEADAFTSMVKSSINDILVGLYFREPQRTDYDDIFEEQYRFQKSFFKYKKPEYPRKPNLTGSKEEIAATLKRIKDNRDPTIMFNSLSRLPWTFSYTVENNILISFLLKNSIVIYNFFKTTLVAIFAMSLYFIYTIFFFKLQFLKQISVWFVIGMLYFWLMSGFNFFLKRYQFGKFTSAIQRFWKRTNTSFWLIEAVLITIFFYYYLNSSQEPVYMYDYSALNQEYLVSLHVAGLNIIILALVIYFMYFTMLRINSNSWQQLNLYLILISIFIFFSFFMETYQFYYVISTFNERLWTFNEEDNLWSIEVDSPILRTKHQYLLVCLIAKYWHFLFIFVSWVFFLIKSFERRKVTFVLFGANLQNIIILYLLNLACYAQWLKWLFRRFLDMPYTWFMVNGDTKFTFRLFFELKLLVFNLFSFNLNLPTYSFAFYKSLDLWNVDSLATWKFL